MATLVSEVSGVVFKLETSVGDEVQMGQIICILESMKMEIPVEATASGVVREILVAEGDSVADGAPIARIE